MSGGQLRESDQIAWISLNFFFFHRCHRVEEDDKSQNMAFNKSSPSSWHLLLLRVLPSSLLSHLLAQRRGAHHHTHNHMQSRQSLRRRTGRLEIRGRPTSQKGRQTSVGREADATTNQSNSTQLNCGMFFFFLPKLHRFPWHLPSEAAKSVTWRPLDSVVSVHTQRAGGQIETLVQMPDWMLFSWCHGDTL